MARIDQAPPAFRTALQTLADAPTRPDIRLWEAVAPTRIAPYSVAINAETTGEHEASGRLVVLYDPAGQDEWEGDFRVIILIKALVEPEPGTDEIMADVAWSWLMDALTNVPYRACGGTVTTEVSRSFGELSSRPDSVQVELRASWTPTDPDMSMHQRVWLSVMASCAGLPPLPEGVTMLHGRTA